MYLLNSYAVCAIERIVGNWFVNRYPARGSLWFARARFDHSGSLLRCKRERREADLKRG